jgi:hypothetical protein
MMNCMKNVSDTICSCEHHSKWSFMMKWCKERGITPACEHNWRRAEEAYHEMIKKSIPIKLKQYE